MRRTIENLLIGTVATIVLMFIIKNDWLHMVVLIILALLTVIILGELIRSLIVDYIEFSNKRIKKNDKD